MTADCILCFLFARSAQRELHGPLLNQRTLAGIFLLNGELLYVCIDDHPHMRARIILLHVRSN